MLKLMHGAGLAFAALLSTAALAQSPDAPLRGRDTSPLPPPNERIPEKIRPNGSPADPDTTGSTLSDKLEKSDGVLRPPPNAAPDMTVKPPEPNPNSTRVIKPGDLPGSADAK
ncbi:hypothetical protein [Methylobacterium nodulans]|uniref:Uncharacterized protein n=1 Tax=Methylobacterium nodulans (strain LMG 21967 / CNCM I-2342 / ORS 2060) TaxID=460265 RepID=B8IPM4_METNO|nr:hypothetical protein [Methylobacterium nodulans]ACL62316.1 conserved hypothetical protein [Methylobacterium nodulans ORS 2060]